MKAPYGETDGDGWVEVNEANVEAIAEQMRKQFPPWAKIEVVTLADGSKGIAVSDDVEVPQGPAGCQ